MRTMKEGNKLHHRLGLHKKAEGPKDLEKELKHHRRLEHLAQASAVAAGAYALHEKHQAKKDPEHAHKHKVAERIAVVVAAGAGGLAFHEHHKKKEVQHRLKLEKTCRRQLHH